MKINQPHIKKNPSNSIFYRLILNNRVKNFQYSSNGTVDTFHSKQKFSNRYITYKFVYSGEKNVLTNQSPNRQYTKEKTHYNILFHF